MKLLGIALVALVAVVSAAPTWNTPKFCGGIDCPKYEVTEINENYEVRVYDASSWVSSKLTCDRSWFPTYTLFRRLFNYISGGNDKNMKIDMTAPVIMSSVDGGRRGCPRNDTMSFFNSPNVVPPTPSDSTVYVENRDKMTVYVKSFGGFQMGWRNRWYARELANALAENGVNFKRDTFYVAGYDAPFKMTDRHNEIWYIGA